MAVVVNGRGIWGVRPAPSDAWTRPTDWLAMPAIGSQEFIGLLAITDDESNHIALSCTGAYTINWGDGVIENVASNVKAQHSYTYSSISEGTLSERGYKQVLVRVTPQAGQNLTNINLQQQNSILEKAYAAGWLDIAINGANITTLNLGGNTVKISLLERAVIGSLGAISDFTSLFYQCFSLQSVSLFNTASATNFSQMFRECFMLKSIPLFNTASGINFSSMFFNCFSLQSVPLLNTSSATTFYGMFNNCYSLQEVPLFSSSYVANFGGMFVGCSSLQTIPLFDTSNATSFGSMFSGCFSLQSVPLIDTSKGTSFDFMVDSCFALKSLPLLNTAKATNLSYMLRNCESLQGLPNLNTALVTNFAGIFSNVPSMAKGALQGTRYSISYTGMCLSKSAVLDIFNGLGTASGTQTITISTNPAFNAKPLNIVGGNWRGITIQSSSQDVYISNVTTGYIHKQTGGVGPFVIDNSQSSFLNGMGTDIYGNIYCARPGTGTYLKKTGGIGSWATISTDVSGMGQMGGDFLGNLYFASNAGLYKQTAMTGSSVQVYSGIVQSFTISPIDGSIYVTDSGATGTIYKQTAGTGSFVSMGIATPGTFGGVLKSDGTLYTVATDIYLTDFSKVITPTDRLIAINKGWTIA